MPGGCDRLQSGMIDLHCEAVQFLGSLNDNHGS